MSYPFKALDNLSAPFPGIPKGIETLIVPHMDRDTQQRMLLVSKVWATAVLDYQARAKFLEQIIDSFGTTFKRSVSLVLADSYKDDIEAIRSLVFSKSIDRFKTDELDKLLQILDTYQDVRHVEYSVSGKVQSEYQRRLHQGSLPAATLQKVASDTVTKLALNFLNALMDERTALNGKPADAKLESEVRTYILNQFAPTTTSLLEKIDKITDLSDFVFTPLGQKLSALEKDWHIALHQWRNKKLQRSRFSTN